MHETKRHAPADLPAEGDTVRVDYTDESRLLSLPRTTIGQVVKREGNVVRVHAFATGVHTQSLVARSVDVDLSVEDGRLVAYRSDNGKRYGPVDELRNVTERNADRADAPTPTIGSE